MKYSIQLFKMNYNSCISTYFILMVPDVNNFGHFTWSECSHDIIATGVICKIYSFDVIDYEMDVEKAMLF